MHLEPHRHSFRQCGDMGDQPDRAFAAAGQLFQGAGNHIEGRLIQRAESLVKQDRVQLPGVRRQGGDLGAQRKGQSQRGLEGLAPDNVCTGRWLLESL